MDHRPLIALASVIVFGTGAQWLAWRLKLPSILLLLACGFLAGPVLNIVNPEEILGDYLFPFVSLCVAIILFEGSLSLHYSQLRETGGVLLGLLTVGAAITWGLALLGARYIIGMDWPIATLLGAILTVTGPTVIGPILRQIRPIGPTGPIARWEGIVIDPIGAVLAVLVYEVIKPHAANEIAGGSAVVITSLAMVILSGGVIGFAAAFALRWLLQRHAIPDHLESLVALLLVVVAFVSSNLVQSESGLVAVTVMGVLLANSGVSLRHISEFKESLSLLLISGLFILLASRVRLDAFRELGWRGPLFVLYMVLLVRPLSVFVSTLSSQLSWKDRVFLGWLAPRGIVAAAVSSVFALELGPENAGLLVPATFSVIVGTVVIYGLTAFPLAKKLGLATDNPQGVLLIGSHAASVAIARAIQQCGFPVLLVDVNHWSLSDARMEGLPVKQVNILREDVEEELDLGGIGRLLAMTSNDEVNSLAAMNLADVFGRANVFQLVPWRRTEKNEKRSPHLRSRYLFHRELTSQSLREKINSGFEVKVTRLTKEFDYAAFRDRYGPEAIPLFIVSNHKLTVCDAEEKHEFKAGQTLIALAPARTGNHDSGAVPLPPSARE